MDVIFGLILLLVLYGTYEYFSHRKVREQIKIRIHVNGARGKSSVTRLIAAGLRKGGIRTFAKTTGTAPRLIYPDGGEVPIFRPGSANIIEQLLVFSEAFRHRVQAIVVECMALQPVLQRLSEEKMVRSTVGVLTNVRPDHLDVMGPTEEDVAQTLCLTIPKKGVLFTSESRFASLIEQEAAKKRTKVHFVPASEVTDAQVRGFNYIEHKENVALALAVCEHLGVPRKKALEGMYEASPDPGALQIYKIALPGRDLFFANAFAANDPVSTLKIWEDVQKRLQQVEKKIVLVNSRGDRISRSEQLAELIGLHLKADYYILVGDFTQAVEARALSLGLRPECLLNFAGQGADKVFEQAVLFSMKGSVLLFAIGNIGGIGFEISRYFRSRAQIYA